MDESRAAKTRRRSGDHSICCCVHQEGRHLGFSVSTLSSTRLDWPGLISSAVATAVSPWGGQSYPAYGRRGALARAWRCMVLCICVRTGIAGVPWVRWGMRAVPGAEGLFGMCAALEEPRWSRHRTAGAVAAWSHRGNQCLEIDIPWRSQRRPSRCAAASSEPCLRHCGPLGLQPPLRRASQEA